MIAPEDIYLYRAVAYNVKRLRLERGLTQVQLAADANIERAKISKIENFKEDFMFSTVLKIAKAFDVSQETILNFTVEIPEGFFLKKSPRVRNRKA